MIKKYYTTIDCEGNRVRIPVDEEDLEAERLFQKGKADRKAGNGCMSANGIYLDGYYSPDWQMYMFIPAAAAHLL